RRLERRRRVEAQDAGARAADVRLQQYGKAQSIDDLPDLLAMIQDDRSGIADSEALEEVDLERLGFFVPPRRHPIDDGDAKALPVGEQRFRVEEDVVVTAPVRRRARP